MEDKEYKRPENAEKKMGWSEFFAIAGAVALAVLTVVVINL